MKRIVVVVLSAILLCSYMFGSTPPTTIQKTFMEKYKTATKISWEKEERNEWEVDFVYEGCKLSAVFAENGSWIETERKIKVAELPTAIAQTIKSIYSDWTIHKIVKKETSKIGIFYDVEMKKKDEKMTVTFNEDGTKVAD